MDRAAKEAKKRFPDVKREDFEDEDEFFDCLADRNVRRLMWREGYRQAEQDLALTWEDVKQIAMISVELSRKRFDDFYVHQTISDEEHFSEVLRRFNAQRKK